MVKRDRQKSSEAVRKMLGEIEISPTSLSAILDRPTERSEDKWGLHSEAGQYISRTSISFIKMPDGTEVVREGIIDLKELARMIKNREL